MEKIAVMVNGLPGKMATLVARAIQESGDFKLIPCSLAGDGAKRTEYKMTTADVDLKEPVHLIYPAERQEKIEIIKEAHEFLTVDFTVPGAVNGNAEFYCLNSLPFVMGTTGGKRDLLIETVCKSSIPAVIAPNMAMPVIMMQAMLEYASVTFPGVLDGYKIGILESHQAKKADKSGTAVSMLPFFRALGISCSHENISAIRDPKQQLQIGVPLENLDGHGWHTYTLVSPDGTVCLEFTHNINGRNVYVDGVLCALKFLQRKVERNATGVFTMQEVLGIEPGNCCGGECRK